MRMVLMCPKCGLLIFPDVKEARDDSGYVCDNCGTKRIDVSETVEDREINYDEDRETFVQRIYRKYLYNNPQFDEETFERRINHRKAFREEIRQTVANSPKCPTCGSTNIRHIGTGERAVSVIGLGLFSGKIGKNYECLNCKARW